MTYFDAPNQEAVRTPTEPEEPRPDDEPRPDEPEPRPDE